MWNIKKITILLCFLSLVAFISCSAEDKTGSPKPEGETEITGETGGSGSGGSGESGSGSGGGTGESGGSGETGGTETTEEGDFPPPAAIYRDSQLSGYSNSDTTITIAGGKTTIEGKAKWSGGAQGFKFEVSKWKKTTKDGKTTFEAVAGNITDAGAFDNTDAVIIYYSDTQTLKITFKDAGDECSFNGTKQP